MCHLGRRLICIKRVDDAESSISTVTLEKGREVAESARETLRRGKGRVCGCSNGGGEGKNKQ